MSLHICNEIETNRPVIIRDQKRRQGVYLLGKTGMGKTTMMQTMLRDDIVNGHGVFFLDPHGDAINSLVPLISRTPLVIDPEDEFYSLGINPLSCANVESEKERQAAYNRTYSIFRKIWAGDWAERPWLQLIIENTLYVFIENQAYTLAEVPLFFMNEKFRNYLLRNMKYNDEVVDFWTFEFSARSQRDQDAQVQAAFTRIRSLLSHPSIRRIIGQHQTTINFSKIIEQKQILFARLSASLPEDQKRFIGIIILNELLHAVRKRIEIPEKERHQFCIFVDEFQNFASSEDFQTLFTEARKYGIASVIAHQERFGQFADNRKIAGATAASVNKVFFQLTTYDADEVAPEVAREPPIEYRREQELTISQSPFYDLLHHSHTNSRIREFTNACLRPIHDKLLSIREKMQAIQIERMGYADDASLARDMASIYGIDARRENTANAMARGRNIQLDNSALDAMEIALSQTMNSHTLAKEQTEKLKYCLGDLRIFRWMIGIFDTYVTALMEGRVAFAIGTESTARFMCDFLGVGFTWYYMLRFYIDLLFGDPTIPRKIPAYLAAKLWPDKLRKEWLKERIPFAIRVNEKSKEEDRIRGVTSLQDESFWAKNLQRSIEEEIRHSRECEILIDEKFGGAHLLTKHETVLISQFATRGNTPYVFEIKHKLEDLPERVFSASEREELLDMCHREIQRLIQMDSDENHNIFAEIDLTVEFCRLISLPENHIKVLSGQYVYHPYYARSPGDMAVEMVQKLVSLKPYRAYAKILSGNDGKDVQKPEITTNPLPEGGGGMAIEEALARTRQEYCVSREEIDAEIRQRRNVWREAARPPPHQRHMGAGEPPDDPPPPHT